LSEIISGRVNMLHLSNDLFTVPKVVMVEGDGDDVRIKANNELELSAGIIWSRYHYIESFVYDGTQKRTGQALIYSIDKIPFCKHDYDKIYGSSEEGPASVLSPAGNPARILSLKWDEYSDFAYIKYLEFVPYDRNLRQYLIVNDGS
jgi:hypothetical protein